MKNLSIVIATLAITACGESKEKQVQVERDYSTRTDVVVVTPAPRHHSPYENNEHRPTPQDRRNSHQTNVQAVVVNPPATAPQHPGFPQQQQQVQVYQQQQSGQYACLCNINYRYVYGYCQVYRANTLAFTGQVNGYQATHEVYSTSCQASGMNRQY